MIFNARWMILLVALGLFGCDSEWTNIYDGYVGTNIGSPVKPSTKMSTKLVLQVDSDSPDDSTQGTQTFVNSSGGAQWCSQTPMITGMETVCNLTMQEYHIGILGVYATICSDEAGNIVEASSPDVIECDTRQELYSGELVNLEISATETTFSQELAALTEDQPLSGIQFVTAYVGQRFPTMEEDPFTARRVATQLRGKSFRICTSPTPTSTEGQVTMLELCGNALAQQGDFLIDMNGDGQFGFLDLASLETETIISETMTRDAEYSALMQSRLHELKNANGDLGTKFALTSFTTDTFYGTPGYYSILYSMSEVTTPEAESEQSFRVVFDMRNAFRFVDGAIKFATEDNINSEGIYHPLDDYSIVVAFPTADVTIENDITE